MQQQIAWGILGCARIARSQFIPAIQRCDNARLQAVASRDPARLAELHDQCGDFTDYASYEALLADPEVQAIYIPLPNSLHCEWAIRAMQAGKHVLCEKPLALNSVEVARMIQTAQDCGVLLMEGFMYRYTERMRLIGEILQSGALGEIRSINSTFRFLLDRVNTIKEKPELGGGALYDIGCYPLSLISLITDGTPISVAAECVQQNGVDINLSAILRYDNGLIASLHCGFNAFGAMHTTITGTKGRLEAPDTFLNDAGTMTLHTTAGCQEIAIPVSDRFGAEVRDFSAAILENRQPLVSLEYSLRNMQTLDQIMAQIQAKR